MGEGHAIDAVLLHPPVLAIFSCVEHAEGELQYLGDSLGVDCNVEEMCDDGWIRRHRNDGKTNEDWFGWNHPLLAPLTGTVVTVRVNEVTNRPGTMGKPPASAIIFAGDDGTHVVFGHVQDIQVAVGDRVNAGDFVARIGNNGMCRNPHVHIGAWRNETPLQIRFDLSALGSKRREGRERTA